MPNVSCHSSGRIHEGKGEISAEIFSNYSNTSVEQWIAEIFRSHQTRWAGINWKEVFYAIENFTVQSSCGHHNLWSCTFAVLSWPRRPHGLFCWLPKSFCIVILIWMWRHFCRKISGGWVAWTAFRRHIHRNFTWPNKNRTKVLLKRTLLLERWHDDGRKWNLTQYPEFPTAVPDLIIYSANIVKASSFSWTVRHLHHFGFFYYEKKNLFHFNLNTRIFQYPHNSNNTFFFCYFPNIHRAILQTGWDFIKWVVTTRNI